MRSVDLALYADVLAGEAASLAARVERERGKQRQASIEREARAALAPFAVERLEELGLLTTRADAATIAELEESLDAVEVLQAWVESALSRAAAQDPLPRTGVSAMRRPPSWS
jgi:hypothetical protein